MGVSLIFVGVRQQNGCFDTHTFIQFSTYAQEYDYCTGGGGEVCALPLNLGTFGDDLQKRSMDANVRVRGYINN